MDRALARLGLVLLHEDNEFLGLIAGLLMLILSVPDEISFHSLCPLILPVDEVVNSAYASIELTFRYACCFTVFNGTQSTAIIFFYMR